MEDRYIIVGTAGHIDHGKSTLIKALTGRETDQLEEEQRRGISINLGFTYFDLPNGERVGIIDVPGHERFIKNMMSGAVGIDIVLMAIAADDGVMPQTIEHAEILTYMGIEDAIIVITKADLLDEEMEELIEMEIKEVFEDTALAKAPIVKVDSISKSGLDDLIDLIQEKSLHIEHEPVEDMPARLNVDRSFSLKGVGTVITGTLLEGKIELGKDYMVYPSEKPANIRSIEVHGQAKSFAQKGQRTAINISNLEKDEIQRGDIIASPGSLTKSDIIDARITLSKNANMVLEHWTRVRVFLGTKEVLARLAPLEGKEIFPGESSLVQIRLEEPVYTKINDPFVIRNYSPVDTIGGGLVVEINSEKHNFRDTDYRQALEKKENFDLKDMIYTYINDSDIGASYEDIYAYSGRLRSDIDSKLDELSRENKILKAHKVYFGISYLEELKTSIIADLKSFHQKEPLESGMSKEALRSQTAMRIEPKDFNLILESQIFEDDLVIDGSLVRLKDFEIDLSPEDEKLKDQILEKISQAQPNLLKTSDFKEKKEAQILTYLFKDQVIKLKDFIISRDFYQELQEKLVAYIKKNGSIQIGEFRDLSGMSRKMALDLLDDFDAKEITKRIDDKRVLF